MLAFPEFSNGFILETDASGDGLGAVLSQKADGRVRPVAYASLALRPGREEAAWYIWFAIANTVSNICEQ